MARKNRESAETENTGVEPDDDTVGNVTPPVDSEADEDGEEDIFDFDFSKFLPEGVKFIDLAPDFVRPEGFLMVPRINKKTGEVFPMTSTFVGILHDIVPWTDERGKQRVWFACEATAEVPGVNLTGQDPETKKDFTKPVLKGTRVGISGSGAINALKTKKGHFIALHWTGRKVSVKNGDMWEVNAQVSEEPVVKPEAEKK